MKRFRLLCDHIGNKRMLQAVRTSVRQIHTKDLKKGIIIARQARYFGVDRGLLRRFVDQHLARAQGGDTPPLDPVPTDAELEAREREEARRRLPRPEERLSEDEQAALARAALAQLKGSRS